MKTINVSNENWQKLSQLKIDNSCKSLDEVVSDLINFREIHDKERMKRVGKVRDLIERGKANGEEA